MIYSTYTAYINIINANTKHKLKVHVKQNCPLPFNLDGLLNSNLLT